MEKTVKSCVYCKLFRIFAASKHDKEMDIHVRYLPEAHGFVKKTGKTPKKEIEKAEAIRKDYFDNN